MHGTSACHPAAGARRNCSMGFNIDSYKRRSAPVALDDVDFTVFERDPLDHDSLRCIRYMHDIEHHTICYLRDLLVTPAHRVGRRAQPCHPWPQSRQQTEGFSSSITQPPIAMRPASASPIISGPGMP